MNIEFIGKFYDNHSLSIINRNILLEIANLGYAIKIVPLDKYDPQYKLDKQLIKKLKHFESLQLDSIEIQLRHSYPPMWAWPEDSNTKVVFIQPWEYPKAPSEWQYKFETFADALIVPSNYCESVFKRGGINPKRVFTVPNGYNKSVFNLEKDDAPNQFGIDPDSFNFVFVGNSQWRKGLDLLLNAWSTAFKRYDSAKLIIKDNPKIYGHSNLLSEILKLQYKTKCGEIIYIDDNLSEQEMASIYKASKVLIHPYRAEGFGMHIQEAVACGCLPIISSDGPSDDFIPDNVGIKLPVVKKAINIQDPNIFAMKPGDSATLMSTHTFINEPVVEYIVKAMQHVYYNYYDGKLYNSVKEATLPTLTDWATVAKEYVKVFEQIKDYKIVRGDT
jgi:glycosyltransferase involved in cell wall biosynthesis